MSFDDFSFQPDPPAAAPPPRAPEQPFEAAQPLARQRPLAAPSRPAAPPSGARARAGLGLVLAGLGTGAGAVLGGPLGALAGLTGVGAVRNLYRSQAIASSDPTEQSDAVRSLAIGVIGVAIAGYLGYKIYSSHKDES